MNFMLLIVAGIGLVSFVLGALAAAVALPYSKSTSSLAQIGIVAACLGGSLFAVTSAALVLFVIALGMSNM